MVGIFPEVTAGVEKRLRSVFGEGNGTPSIAPNLALKSVTFSSIDKLFFKVTIETRGAVIPVGDPALDGVTYRIAIDKDGSKPTFPNPRVVWTIRGANPQRGAGRGPATPRYVVTGEGVEPDVTVSGNTISIKGILPTELAGASALMARTETAAGATSAALDFLALSSIPLSGLHSPEVDLSASTKENGPYRIAYEGFHWPAIPRSQDVACSVIAALGDKFDFIASYSDFRVDNPEGGTPSTGPRGGNVSGIGSNTNGLENYCSNGELQWMYVEPVSTSAVQIQERSPDGRMTDYNYAMSQIGHELGHRWAADARARQR